jgi:beta-glucosidase/6-phospho-beta-glucosidase/beta-galactosidase
MGGFECSSHRKRSGRRLDLIASTRHDEFAEADYTRMVELGMKTARDGLRWHLIETEPYRYDLSSLESQVKAARSTGIQIVWDYFHYGYPDDLDIQSEEFVERFARFSVAVTEFLISELGSGLIFCPVNEISFFSWAAGTAGIFYPFSKNRGIAIKRQLVKCHIAAVDAVRSIVPKVRWMLTEPAIHVIPGKGGSKQAAAKYRLAQFQALDMITGRAEPELGGAPGYLDMIGLNYYVHNQWTHPGRRPVRPTHRLYKPPHQIFGEFYSRYDRPMIIAETGIEDDRRAEWFRFVAEETQIAIDQGVPLHGLCLYPIVNHPGWEDGRHCHNGLWDYADDDGSRPLHEPLADAIREFSL